MSTSNTRGNPAIVLLQAHVPDGVAPEHLDTDALAFCAVEAPLLRVRRAAFSAAASAVYVYLEPVHGALPDAYDAPGALDALGANFARRCPWAADVRASRLEQVFDAGGASAHEAPVFHYVVEMEPEAGWMPEIARWYDTEHMPGLAAVPGCVRASRFLNHGHGPLSLACYDLVREETLGSPPWLAVRATAWSDIARPHFTDTRRTMFRIAPPTQRAD